MPMHSATHEAAQPHAKAAWWGSSAMGCELVPASSSIGFTGWASPGCNTLRRSGPMGMKPTALVIKARIEVSRNGPPSASVSNCSISGPA